ncbi:unnamed protein product [Diabrotica balteata]|uniref:Uncharacterized protein n=1 Tax=Diabrotica balteata TaxID=107213 RepID=A0A9N9X481_DIABA|nr:unnamed protein product [Diabrotica balteata]
MLQELYTATKRVGLKIFFSKTQFMTDLVHNKNISVEDKDIEPVDSYKYLGHEIRISRDNQTIELKRRINLAWAAFGKIKNIFRSTIPMCLKRKVINQFIFPVMTYGAETLTLTKITVSKLQIAERAMERKYFST